MNIQILNGPNLNLTGKRTPAVYGTTSMETVVTDIQRQWPTLMLSYMQSNHEGDLIDCIQKCTEDGTDAIVLNAGGYTHTSVAIRDAVEYAMEQGVEVVEVHISNITEREAFRRESLLSDVCSFRIIGHGTEGYKDAIRQLIEKHDKK